MDDKIIQAQKNIKLYEQKLIKLGERLSEALDNNNHLAYKIIEAEIYQTQRNLKNEFELLNEIKN